MFKCILYFDFMVTLNVLLILFPLTFLCITCISTYHAVGLLFGFIMFPVVMLCTVKCLWVCKSPDHMLSSAYLMLHA